VQYSTGAIDEVCKDIAAPALENCFTARSHTEDIGCGICETGYGVDSDAKCIPCTGSQYFNPFEFELNQVTFKKENGLTNPTEGASDWVQLLRAPGSQQKWYPVTDKLASYASDTSFDQFLFTTGNFKKWLAMTKDELIGTDGQAWYTEHDPGRAVLATHLSSKKHQWYLSSGTRNLKMVRRKDGHPEDPWVSCLDHDEASKQDDTNCILFGGDSQAAPLDKTYNLIHHDGARVFKRHSKKSLAPAEMNHLGGTIVRPARNKAMPGVCEDVWSVEHCYKAESHRTDEGCAECDAGYEEIRKKCFPCSGVQFNRRSDPKGCRDIHIAAASNCFQAATHQDDHGCGLCKAGYELVAAKCKPCVGLQYNLQADLTGCRDIVATANCFKVYTHGKDDGCAECEAGYERRDDAKCHKCSDLQYSFRGDPVGCRDIQTEGKKNCVRALSTTEDKGCAECEAGYELFLARENYYVCRPCGGIQFRPRGGSGGCQDISFGKENCLKAKSHTEDLGCGICVAKHAMYEDASSGVKLKRCEAVCGPPDITQVGYEFSGIFGGTSAPPTLFKNDWDNALATQGIVCDVANGYKSFSALESVACTEIAGPYTITSGCRSFCKHPETHIGYIIGGDETESFDKTDQSGFPYRDAWSNYDAVPNVNCDLANGYTAFPLSDSKIFFERCTRAGQEYRLKSGCAAFCRHPGPPTHHPSGPGYDGYSFENAYSDPQTPGPWMADWIGTATVTGIVCADGYVQSKDSDGNLKNVETEVCGRAGEFYKAISGCRVSTTSYTTTTTATTTKKPGTGDVTSGGSSTKKPGTGSTSGDTNTNTNDIIGSGTSSTTGTTQEIPDGDGDDGDDDDDDDDGKTTITCADTNADGQDDQCFTQKGPDCAIVEKDTDFDGKIDVVIRNPEGCGLDEKKTSGTGNNSGGGGADGTTTGTTTSIGKDDDDDDDDPSATTGKSQPVDLDGDGESDDGQVVCTDTNGDGEDDMCITSVDKDGDGIYDCSILEMDTDYDGTVDVTTNNCRNDDDDDSPTTSGSQTTPRPTPPGDSGGNTGGNTNSISPVGTTSGSTEKKDLDNDDITDTFITCTDSNRDGNDDTCVTVKDDCKVISKDTDFDGSVDITIRQPEGCGLGGDALTSGTTTSIGGSGGESGGDSDPSTSGKTVPIRDTDVDGDGIVDEDVSGEVTCSDTNGDGDDDLCITKINKKDKEGDTDCAILEMDTDFDGIVDVTTNDCEAVSTSTSNGSVGTAGTTSGGAKTGDSDGDGKDDEVKVCTDTNGDGKDDSCLTTPINDDGSGDGSGKKRCSVLKKDTDFDGIVDVTIELSDENCVKRDDDDDDDDDDDKKNTDPKTTPTTTTTQPNTNYVTSQTSTNQVLGNTKSTITIGKPDAKNIIATWRQGDIIVGEGIPKGSKIESIKTEGKNAILTMSDKTMIPDTVKGPLSNIPGGDNDNSKVTVNVKDDKTIVITDPAEIEKVKKWQLGDALTGEGIPGNTIIKKIKINSTHGSQTGGKLINEITFELSNPISTNPNLDDNVENLLKIQNIVSESLSGTAIGGSTTIKMSGEKNTLKSWKVGDPLIGIGIAPGTVITAIDPENGFIQISQPTTSDISDIQLANVANQSVGGVKLVKSVGGEGGGDDGPAGNANTQITVPDPELIQHWQVGDALSGVGIQTGTVITNIDKETGTITVDKPVDSDAFADGSDGKKIITRVRGRLDVWIPPPKSLNSGEVTGPTTTHAPGTKIVIDDPGGDPSNPNNQYTDPTGDESTGRGRPRKKEKTSKNMSAVSTIYIVMGVLLVLMLIVCLGLLSVYLRRLRQKKEDSIEKFQGGKDDVQGRQRRSKDSKDKMPRGVRGGISPALLDRLKSAGSRAPGKTQTLAKFETRAARLSELEKTTTTPKSGFATFTKVLSTGLGIQKTRTSQRQIAGADIVEKYNAVSGDVAIAENRKKSLSGGAQVIQAVVAAARKSMLSLSGSGKKFAKLMSEARGNTNSPDSAGFQRVPLKDSVLDVNNNDLVLTDSSVENSSNGEEGGKDGKSKPAKQKKFTTATTGLSVPSRKMAAAKLGVASRGLVKTVTLKQKAKTKAKAGNLSARESTATIVSNVTEAGQVGQRKTGDDPTRSTAQVETSKNLNTKLSQVGPKGKAKQMLTGTTALQRKININTQGVPVAVKKKAVKAAASPNAPSPAMSEDEDSEFEKEQFSHNANDDIIPFTIGTSVLVNDRAYSTTAEDICINDSIEDLPPGAANAVPARSTAMMQKKPEKLLGVGPKSKSGAVAKSKNLVAKKNPAPRSNSSISKESN